MTRFLLLGLAACAAGLSFIAVTQQSELLINLIVAPAIGLVGCLLLIVLAHGSVVRPAREYSGTQTNEGREA